LLDIEAKNRLIKEEEVRSKKKCLQWKQKVTF